MAERAAERTARACPSRPALSLGAIRMPTLPAGLGTAPSAPVRPAELVRVRLEAALLTGRATRLEQKIVGGRGYALASDTSRRAREAAFLPVQSPTETHLRHLLARAGVPVPSDGRA